MDDLGLHSAEACDGLHPLLVLGRLNPVLGVSRPLPQSQCKLGAETRSEANGVVHGILPALGEPKIPEIRVRLFEVWNGRDGATLQGFDGHSVFNTGPHGVAGEALGVGHHNLVGVGAKSAPECIDFGGCRPATRRRIGLVAHEECTLGHLAWGDSIALAGLFDQGGELPRDVLDVQSGSVEGRVDESGSQQFSNRGDSTLLRGLGCLEDESDGAHANDHAVATSIKGEGCLGDFLGCGRCTRCQEACTDPLHEVVRRRVVCAKNDDPFAASESNPVLCQRDALSRGCAGCIHLGVGSSCTDELSELRMTHGQNLEEKASIKVSFLSGAVFQDFLCELVVAREG